MPYALDYSAGRPTAAQVLAAGYVGVIRYIGFPARAKCITRAEYADMTNNGVPVALVYENQAGDMLGGNPAGRAAANLARAHATDIGFPAGEPIYYACDTDIIFGAARWAALAAAGALGLVEHLRSIPLTVSQMAAVLDYLRGAVSVEGSVALVGVYGEYDVMEQAAAAGVARYFWQTRAWSGGRTSTRAQVRQEIGTYTVGGIACDRNTILAPDWGQTGTGIGDQPMSAAEVDRVIVAVNDARDLLYEIRRGKIPDGHGGFVADPGHVEMADTTANARLTALAGAVAAIGAKVGALSNDEANVLARVDADTAKILAAVQAVIVAPGVDNADPDAFVAALRDALVRGEPPVPA